MSVDYFGSSGESRIQVRKENRINRLPGQYYDQETGLHYNYYRYFDPDTGRYITSDPIGLNGGLNLYAYVYNNPLTNFDLFGLMGWGSEEMFNYCSVPGNCRSFVNYDPPAAPDPKPFWVPDGYREQLAEERAERERQQCEAHDQCIKECVQRALLNEAGTQVAEKTATYAARRAGSKALSTLIPLAGQISTGKSVSDLAGCYLFKCK